MKLAVPVQGVPVGLSLMNSGQAHGSIEIADASTYGIDQRSIDAQVDAWAQCPDVQALLKRYAFPARQDGKPVTEQYIRVITRVFLTGRVNISLQNDEARGAGLDAGVAQTVGAIANSDAGDAAKRAAENYASVLSALNGSLAGATGATGATGGSGSPAQAAGTLAGSSIPKPGGSIRIMAASSRSVSMSETFDRPLVIGYLAYDRPIGKDGTLGGSAPTLQRVEGRPMPVPKLSVDSLLPAKPPTDSVTTFEKDTNSVAINNWLKQPGTRSSSNCGCRKTTST